MPLSASQVRRSSLHDRLSLLGVSTISFHRLLGDGGSGGGGGLLKSLWSLRRYLSATSPWPGLRFYTLSRICVDII